MEPLDYTRECIQSLFDLTGKTAMITGGAGTTGFAIAKGLAEYGANIVLIGRTRSKLEEAKAELGGRKGTIHTITANCSDEKECQRAVTETINTFGKIDVLVASVNLVKRFPAQGFPTDIFDKVIETNVRGTYLINKIVGEHMIRQNKGKIINISSVRAEKGHSLGYSAYAASKGAIQSYSRQLAVEWAKHDINVNCIATTELVTPITKEIFDDPEKGRVFTENVPFGRVAIPDELIGAAVFLASSASDFVTGQTIYVDGGNTAS